MVKTVSHLEHTFQPSKQATTASAHTVNKCPLHVLFTTTFFTFCAFRWWFCYLKWTPSTVLKSCLVFLSARSLWCALWKKNVSYISIIQARVIVLLAMSSMWIDQQYILNKVTFNTNTYKTRLCTEPWMKTLWWEVCRKLTLYLS